MKSFYKGARPDGWDFQTGNTINYRENIGKTVSVPATHFEVTPTLCSVSVLHASPKPNGIFVGSKIPCSVYIVKGKPVVHDSGKAGFKQLFIEREIPQSDLNDLFGWNYSEVCHPVNPLMIQGSTVEQRHIVLLQKWDSVRASVWDSVWDSVGAYIGSLFPNIKKWKYVKHKHGEYPFQSAVDLWRQGLVPSFDGQTWRLHAEPKAKVVFEIEKELLLKVKT